MLLTERIANCTSAIQRKRTAQENKQSVEAYTKALVKLDAASEKLKATLSCAAALKEKGVVSQPLITEQIRDDLLECANSCGRGLFDGQLTDDMVSILIAKSDTFAGQIGYVWKDAARKYAEGVQGYLSLIGGLTSEPKKADDLNKSIAKTIGGPVSVDAIDSLVHNVATAKKITDSFALNSQIEEFLLKVSNRKATIMDLTPEVQKWLKSKGLSGKLKICF